MLLSNVNLYYPSAREWMWNYCIYLGPFTDEDGKNYDLGVHIDEYGDVSAAIVDGNTPGNYFSGNLTLLESLITRPIYHETIKRARTLGLMKKDEPEVVDPRYKKG